VFKVALKAVGGDRSRTIIKAFEFIEFGKKNFVNLKIYILITVCCPACINLRKKKKKKRKR